jgi:pyruvate/2-oxoglutarate dehydrogenase complex dihydrolipoamide dehydrogenase (E3) component
VADRYDLVIVGMGSGGMVAAEFAASLDLKVAVVERDRVGGDCLWTGCVPSKALLASAKAAHAMRAAGSYGIASVQPAVDGAAVWSRIRAVQSRIAQADDNPERFRELGAELVFGGARLVSPTEVEVEGHGVLRTRYVLLCTGSRPAVPPLEGLTEAGFVTSETLWGLQQAPASVVAVGGGPIAVELSQALQRLGTSTTLLQRGEGILPRDEPELSRLLADRLRAEGVQLELGVEPERVTVEDGAKVVHARGRSWSGERILLGTGRVPNTDGLGLEEVGIEVGPRGVAVDGAYRTSAKTVYAIGDLAGRHLFTHSAGYEAARAVRNMFVPGRQKSDFTVPWCTFTDPELAHVGLTSGQAAAQHGERKVRTWRLGLDHNDRARADSADEGVILIVTAKDRIVGAHALAPSAGELIHELTLAVYKRLKLTELARVVHIYPTLAIGVQQLAAEASYERARRYRWLAR